MVASAIPEAKMKEHTGISVIMPEDPIIESGISSSSYNLTRKKKINLVLTPVFKAKAEYRCQRLMQQERKARLFIITSLLALALMTTILVMSQRRFMVNVRKELLLIRDRQMSLSMEHYPTEETPYIILDDQVMDEASEFNVIMSQPNNMDVTAVEIDSTVATAPFPNAGVSDKTATQTHKVSEELDFTTITTMMEKYAVQGDNTDDAKIIAEDVLNSKAEEVADETKEIQGTESSAIVPQESNDDADFHEHTRYENTDEMIDFLKIDVVFKIYAYIYAFYISVTFLMLIQFYIIVRLLFAKRSPFSLTMSDTNNC